MVKIGDSKRYKNNNNNTLICPLNTRSQGRTEHHGPLLPMPLLVMRLAPAAQGWGCPAQSWSASQLARCLPSLPMREFLCYTTSQMRKMCIHT